MNSTELPKSNHAFATLRRFTRRRPALERCELCSLALTARHQHLIEPSSRRLLCACDACAILFSDSADGKYKRVPRRALGLPQFRLSEAQWDRLLIPINMAFFFYSTPAERIVAFYPSPAGATESLLQLDAWEEIVSDNPLLKSLRADVEALLVKRLNRIGEQGDQTAAEYYIVPIDQCYRLVGLIRAHWRGLSGGTEVWQEIRRFFIDLRADSQPFKESSHA